MNKTSKSQVMQTLKNAWDSEQIPQDLFLEMQLRQNFLEGQKPGSASTKQMKDFMDDIGQRKSGQTRRRMCAQNSLREKFSNYSKDQMNHKVHANAASKLSLNVSNEETFSVAQLLDCEEPQETGKNQKLLKRVETEELINKPYKLTSEELKRFIKKFEEL